MRHPAVLVAACLLACACGRAQLSDLVPTATDAGSALGDGALAAPALESGVAEGAPTETGSDAGVLGGDGAVNEVDAAGIPELGDCLASRYEMHAVASGYGGLTGSFGVNGDRGTWSGSVASESVMTFKVDVGGGWEVDVESDFVDGQFLQPGTYASGVPGKRLPSARVAVDGMGCSSIPSGTFTIVDIGTTGGDEASLTRLVAWFDLTCNGQGTLRGCVRYAE